jgi:hypothetical protein
MSQVTKERKEEIKALVGDTAALYAPKRPLPSRLRYYRALLRSFPTCDLEL